MQSKIHTYIPLLKNLTRIITIIGLIVSGYFAYQLYAKKQTIHAEFKTSVIARTQEASKEIEQFLNQSHDIIKKLALNAVITNPDQAKNELSKKPIALSGLGIIYFDSSTGWYYVEKDDQQQLIAIDQPYIKSADWLEKIKDSATQIILDPIGQKSIATGALFYNSASGKPAGIIFATQSNAHLNHLLATLTPQEGGNWVLTYKNNVFATSQDTDKDNKHLQELTTKTDQSSSFYATQDSAGKKKILITTQPLTQADFKMHGIFDAPTLQNDSSFARHAWMMLIIFLLLSLFFFALSLLLVTTRLKIVWLISSLSTLIAISALIFFWYIAQHYTPGKQSDFAIKNKVSLYQFLDTHIPGKKSATSSAKDLEYYLRYRYKNNLFVPTGVFINDVDFTSTDQVQIVGYIWQRYFDGIHDGISRGFLLPQAATRPQIKKIFQTKRDKVEIIIWQFYATINQKVSYKTYPFDAKNIQLQLWHQDFDKEVTLVPDLDAYGLPQSAQLPQLSSFAHVSGWRIISSNFGYQMPSYYTNFGLYDYGPFGVYKTINRSKMPELYFNISVKRHLLETLLTELVPLLVIAILLFVTLLTAVGQGFAGFVQTLAAVFFGTIVAHLKFREKIPAHELVYFETFFLVMYIFIALVLAINFLDLSGFHIRFIRYKKNLISQVIFWPLLLITLLIITIGYLY